MSTPIQRQVLAEKHKQARANRNKQPQQRPQAAKTTKKAAAAAPAPATATSTAIPPLAKKTKAIAAAAAAAAIAAPATKKKNAARPPKAALAAIQAPAAAELKPPRKRRMSRGVVARRWVGKLQGKWSNCRIMHMKHINDLVRSFAVFPHSDTPMRINEDVFPIAYCILDHRIRDILDRVKSYMVMRDDTEVRSYHVRHVLALMDDNKA